MSILLRALVCNNALLMERAQTSAYNKGDAAEGSPRSVAAGGSFGDKPGMELTIDQARSLPEGGRCGVYFLWQGEKLQYVGASRAISARLYMHGCAARSHPLIDTYHNKVPHDRATVLECVPSDLREMEARLIVKFQPPFNKLGKRVRR